MRDFIAIIAFLAVVAALVFFGLSFGERRGNSVASAAASVMVQAFETGYQCAVDKKPLDVCREAYKKRIWKGVKK